MVVLEILDYLNSFAPFSLAEDYDNVGLIIGSREKEVRTVVVSLDLTSNVLKEALKLGAELIISHHPVIFKGVKNIMSDELIYRVVESKISVISIHTNLDRAEFGVSYWLAKKLGLNAVEKLIDSGDCGRIGLLEKALNFEDFLKFVSKKLNTLVRATKCTKKINRVAVLGGAGGFALNSAIRACADGFITADVKHDVLIKACEKDICLVDAGHFETERVVLEPLKRKLEEKFKEVKFFVFCKQGLVHYCFGENVWR